MLQTTAREIADLTGGTLVGGATGDELVTGTAVIDSRDLEPGDLFAAFRGEHADGHDHLAAAQQTGAAIALVSEDRGTPAVQAEPVEVAKPAACRPFSRKDTIRGSSSAMRMRFMTGSPGG